MITSHRTTVEFCLSTSSLKPKCSKLIKNLDISGNTYDGSYQIYYRGHTEMSMFYSLTIV